VIEWVQEQETFIAKALSPARVSGVYLEDDIISGRTAVVIVPDDQLSLAIGREGQNARLAAKLTGWRIDIKSVTEAVQDALNKLDQPPLEDLAVKFADMVSEVIRILEKKASNRTVQPEEYTTLSKFADISERRLLTQRNAARAARMAEINAVKATLPQGAFELPVDTLELSAPIIEALQPLGNVGEIMWRFLIDESYLRQLLSDLASDSFFKLQSALDKVVIPDVVEVEAPPALEVVIAEPVEEDEEEEPVVAALAETEEDAELDAFPDEAPVAALPPLRKPQPVAVAQPIAAPAVVPVDVDADADTEEGGFDADKTGEGDKKKSKEKQKRRQLVFDESSGEVVTKRRRKGRRSGGREDWDDYLG